MTKEDGLQLYEKMLTIRKFEEMVSEFRYNAEVYGAVHCCIGQEAVSVGVCSALRRKDRIIGTHRSHGYMIAKGANINEMMAELFGKSTGTNGGRGGSLHVCDPSIGALGATGIVGSGIPIACGSAFAAKYNNESIVSVVFLGDGASNEGVFYESLNLASKWELPVIFLVENNGLAVTTRNITTTANINVFEHAASFGMRGQVVDGQDVEEVYNVTKEAVERIIKQSKPEIIEARTCRFHEHAEGKGYLRMVGTGYRDEDVKEQEIKKRDPILLYEEKLHIIYGVSSDEINDISISVNKKIKESVRFAKSSNEPDPRTAYDNVFVEAQR